MGELTIRAMALDIDGTLTDMSRRMDPASLSALYRLKVPVVLATGNTHCFTRAISIMLGSHHFVAENGGVISIHDRMEMLASREPCDRAFQILQENFEVQAFDSRYRLTDLVLKNDFDLELAGRILQDAGLPVELVDTGFAVHIKNRSVSKATGLKRVSEILDIPMHQFVAVGDSYSDIPMMEVAGYAAAVANAREEVKAVCDYVSAGPFGQGFAGIVEHLIQEDMFQL
ncbi:MAG: phosphoglycolate phosphatase [Methanosarcinales archaeon]|nr:phosphoglycolate phosphatase [Methanosarcinales archaeon]